MKICRLIKTNFFQIIIIILEFRKTTYFFYLIHDFIIIKSNTIIHFLYSASHKLPFHEGSKRETRWSKNAVYKKSIGFVIWVHCCAFEEAWNWHNEYYSLVCIWMQILIRNNISYSLAEVSFSFKKLNGCAFR